MAEQRTLHLISHTHWDREWYQTFQQFRFRLVELIDRLLELLARDERFRYFHLDGQTILLEDYAEARPTRMAELAEHIAAGRVLVGPWYVQPDEFLVSGEAMIRNLQIGRRIARRYGEPMPVGYLPDTFGHIAQMPQIMRGFGIDNFVLGRGLSGAQTGGTEFWWQGLDGSRLLGCFLACWYHNAMRVPADPEAALAFVQQVDADLTRAGARDHLLLMNGCDHLIAQENLGEVLEILEERYHDGRVLHSTLPQAIAALRELPNESLNVLAGELRDETPGPLLTGVLSARVGLKQANAACENLLEAWVEPLEAMAALRGKPYDRDYLRYAWKLLLQNHPHDSICGCSLDQVHAEMLPRFAQVQQLGEELLRRAVYAIAAEADTTPRGEGEALESVALLVVNPLPRARDEVGVFELDFAQRPELCGVELVGPDGRVIPAQVLGRTQRTRKDWGPDEIPHEVPVSRYRVAAFLEGLPPCGYRVYSARLLKGLPPQREGLAHSGGLANEHLALALAEDGTLRLAPQGDVPAFAGLGFFRDGGDVGDQYNYVKPVEDQVAETSGERASVRRRVTGELSAELEIEVRPRVPSAARADRQGRAEEQVELPIRQRVRLNTGSPLVEIHVEVENRARDHRLRVVFPLGAPVASARAGTSFGVVDRPQAKPAWWSYESRDRPHRGFVDVRVPGRGLAILTRGLYEHDLRADGQLEITLLRGVGHMFVDPATLHAWDGVEEGQCLGTHRFEYAVLPHDGKLPIEEIAEAARRYTTPLRGWQVPQHAGPLGAEHSFLQLEPVALQLSALKWAEDREGLIVRCFNTTAERVAGTLRLGGRWRAAYRVNLDEARGEGLAIGGDGSIAIEAAPWQIVTLELEASPAQPR
jgi:mannosylglycerate hydrolase